MQAKQLLTLLHEKQDSLYESCSLIQCILASVHMYVYEKKYTHKDVDSVIRSFSK